MENNNGHAVSPVDVPHSSVVTGLNNLDHGLVILMEHSRVLLGQHAVHVLDELVGLVDLIGLEVVDHQVESGFGDHVEERRQNLKCVFASPED